MADVVLENWEQILALLAVIWGASNKFADLARRLDVEQQKNQENAKKIEELFRLHNAHIERLLNDKK